MEGVALAKYRVLTKIYFKNVLRLASSFFQLGTDLTSHYQFII